MAEFSVNDYIRTGQVSFKEPVADAFGRIRVSEPYTVFDGKFLYDSGSLQWDHIAVGTGAGLGTIGSTATIDLHVNNSGSRTVRQSRRYLVYQPAKSQEDLLTGVLMPSGSIANVRCRIGVFDDARDKTYSSTVVDGNGYFWEHDGTNFNVVKRSYTNGTQVDTRVSQSAWNYDRMDGTGSSSILIDPSKVNIFFMDQEWLGAGTVRMGFVVNGNIYYAHKFHHANIQKDMHTQTATLPLRYEIERMSGNGAATMVQGCCSCISEGGYNPRGRVNGFMKTTTVNAANGAWTPMLSIRLKPSQCRASLIPLKLDILCVDTNRQFYYALIHGTPNVNQIALTNVSWQDVANSCAQTDIASTAYSGGRIIQGGFASTGQREASIDLADEIILASSIIGEPEILTLICWGVGGTAAIAASMTWREIF